MNDAEYFQPASTDEELLPVVDEHDAVIGVRPRRQVHLEGLRHRSVQVCILDGQGRIWLQQRSRSKDTYPGYWDFAATGHVDPEETYDAATRRELREELGIDAQPQPMLKIEASARTGWEFQSIYWLKWDEPIEGYDRTEVEQMRPFTLEEIRRAVLEPDSPWPVTPCVVDHLPRIARMIGITPPEAGANEGEWKCEK